MQTTPEILFIIERTHLMLLEMEKFFFTFWAVFNAFIYALLISFYILIYINFRNKSRVFIFLNTIIIIILCYTNFRSISPHQNRTFGNRSINKVLDKKYFEIDNLGTAKLDMLLSYDADSVYNQQIILSGFALGHVWKQEFLHTHILKNTITYSMKGNMQWRFLGYPLYNQPKYFKGNMELHTR